MDKLCLDITKVAFDYVKSSSSGIELSLSKEIFIGYAHGRFHNLSEYVYDCEVTHSKTGYKARADHYASAENACKQAAYNCYRELRKNKMV